MSTASFQDRTGKTWSTAVTVNTVRRVKELVGIDLLDVFDGRLFARLEENPVLLVNTLYLGRQLSTRQNPAWAVEFTYHWIGKRPTPSLHGWR